MPWHDSRESFEVFVSLQGFPFVLLGQAASQHREGIWHLQRDAACWEKKTTNKTSMCASSLWQTRCRFYKQHTPYFAFAGKPSVGCDTGAVLRVSVSNGAVLQLADYLKSNQHRSRRFQTPWISSGASHKVKPTPTSNFLIYGGRSCSKRSQVLKPEQERGRYKQSLSPGQAVCRRVPHGFIPD